MASACYVCRDECRHERPIARSKNLPARIPDDLGAVILPGSLGKLYVGKNGHDTTRVRDAKRYPDGTPMVRTAGDGNPHWPKVEAVTGDAAERYTEGCCTVSAPCDKHRAALLGRDWKTGEIG